MSSTQNPEADGTAAPATATATEGQVGPVRAISLGLWVVVGALLTYGVAQTVLKASALFA